MTELQTVTVLPGQVRRIRNQAGTIDFQAYCRCGFEGPWRTMIDEANASLSTHEWEGYCPFVAADVLNAEGTRFGRAWAKWQNATGLKGQEAIEAARSAVADFNAKGGEQL